MHRIELSAALAQSVQHALETMCFAEAMPVPEAALSSVKRMSIPFRGSISGDLYLDVSAGTARMLTSAFLGLQQGEMPAEPCVNDMICELGTVICGRFLSCLDPTATLHLGEAQLRDLAPGTATVPAALRQYFQLDCGYMAVFLQLE